MNRFSYLYLSRSFLFLSLRFVFRRALLRATAVWAFFSRRIFSPFSPFSAFDRFPFCCSLIFFLLLEGDRKGKKEAERDMSEGKERDGDAAVPIATF